MLNWCCGGIKYIVGVINLVYWGGIERSTIFVGQVMICCLYNHFCVPDETYFFVLLFPQPSIIVVPTVILITTPLMDFIMTSRVHVSMLLWEAYQHQGFWLKSPKDSKKQHRVLGSQPMRRSSSTFPTLWVVNISLQPCGIFLES